MCQKYLVFETPSFGSPAHVEESIVDFGKCMGLEVRGENVHNEAVILT